MIKHLGPFYALANSKPVQSHTDLIYLASSVIQAGGNVYIDKDSKSNGDSVLMRSICSAITGLVYDASSINPDELKQRDLYILYNIDKPHHLKSKIDKISGRCNIALYTLYHPRRGILFYYLSTLRLRGFFLFLEHLLPYEHLYNLFKYRHFINGKNLVDIFFYLYKPLAIACNGIDFIVTSGIEEESKLKPLLKGSNCKMLKQSHLPLKSDSFSIQDYDSGYILCVGRNEPRKNISEIWQLACNYDNYRFKIVTTPPALNCQKSSQLPPNSLANVEIIYNADETMIVEFIRAAHVILTPSLFEVMSLIDITAIHHNKIVVSTVNSYIGSFPGVYLHDPAIKGDLCAKFKLAIGL